MRPSSSRTAPNIHSVCLLSFIALQEADVSLRLSVQACVKKNKKKHQTLVPAGMRKNLVGDVDILTQVEWITSSSEG